jgi:hypothetical protein
MKCRQIITFLPVIYFFRVPVKSTPTVKKADNLLKIRKNPIGLKKNGRLIPLECGVAQIRVRRSSNRVRFPARHPYGDHSSEQQQ